MFDVNAQLYEQKDMYEKQLSYFDEALKHSTGKGNKTNSEKT